MKVNDSILILIFFFLSSCASQRPVKSTQHENIKYVRATWKHWIDQDGNCLDTRGEILKSRSIIQVQLNKKGCKVKTGQWKDYYYPEVHHLAAKVDLDHLVPLKYAHDHGAANWSHADKERFANDPENLVITNRRYNRQKGAKGIDQWLPVHKEYACRYMKDWMKIKNKYRLNITQQEKTAISGC